MKELRFLQPNKIDKETLNDPVKLKAYFDWKYENFEEEYKVYCAEKRKLRKDFLNALSPEKKEKYLNRYKEYMDRYFEIDKRYFSVLENAFEIQDIAIIEKTLDEEREEYDKLSAEFKDIDFML